MKPITIYNDKFLDLISWSFRVGGISIFPFIILRENRKGSTNGGILVNHETIHFWQTLELGIVGFYLLYIIFYMYYIVKTKFKIEEAYMMIPFEKEAYSNEKNLDYIKNRGVFSWVKYINK